MQSRKVQKDYFLLEGIKGYFRTFDPNLCPNYDRELSIKNAQAVYKSLHQVVAVLHPGGLDSIVL